MVNDKKKKHYNYTVFDRKSVGPWLVSRARDRLSFLSSCLLLSEQCIYMESYSNSHNCILLERRSLFNFTMGNIRHDIILCNRECGWDLGHRHNAADSNAEVYRQCLARCVCTIPKALLYI